MVAVKAPFPWFGGKRQVAPLVWRAFGDVVNYVEPFFGSGAVLLGRPEGWTGPETINDKDMFVANFWRALQADPDAVAHHADWPVNEADLEARHRWLVNDGSALLSRGMGEPRWYDAEIAGWWVWGQSCWIGSNWCGGVDGGWRWSADDGWIATGDAGMGIKRQRPHLGNGGMGIHRKLPHLGDAGRGVHRKLPHLGDAGTGVHRKRADLQGYMRALADRLRGVRVCCGDWSRVCGPSSTFKHGLTGVFLDPPYAAERSECYAEESRDVSATVREWCAANGDNPLLRIALCGYEGEHELPATWRCVEWKACGGYGSQGEGRGRENSHKERIWFSPACIPDDQLVLL